MYLLITIKYPKESVQIMETNSKNNVSSLIDIETNKLTEFIDQSIIKCMNSAIENNHLSKEKILFLSDNSLVPIKYEKNQSIFDYLFLKLKEYALFNILSNLTFSIDVKYHRLIPEAEGIARLLLSLNGKQYDSNSNPTDNITSASQIPIKNATTTKFKELNEILFNQESYISLLNSTTLKNRDVFENVYHNISTTIGNTLFINYLPFLYFEENIQTILGNPNLKHKKNDQRKLPITSSYFICNTCYNYYKPKNNKFYSVSETLLANLNNNNQIKTDFDSLVTNYNEDLRQYCSIFNELSKKKIQLSQICFIFIFQVYSVIIFLSLLPILSLDLY